MEEEVEVEIEVENHQGCLLARRYAQESKLL